MTVVELNFIDYLLANLHELEALKVEISEDTEFKSVFSEVLTTGEGNYCYSVDSQGYVVDGVTNIVHQSTVSRIDEVVERIKEGSYVSCRLRKAQQLVDLRDQLIISTFNSLLINKVFTDSSFTTEISKMDDGGSIVIPRSMWRLVTSSTAFSSLIMSDSIDKIVKGYIGRLSVGPKTINVYVDFENQIEGTLILGNPEKTGRYKSVINHRSTTEVWWTEEELTLQFSNLSNCSMYTL